MARANTIYGVLDLLILKTLSLGTPMHGLDIARQIGRLSEEFLHVEEGALYPALHRLQQRGLIEGEWRISEKRRRARFYTLTPAGREELQKEIRSWVRHTSAVRRVLDVAWGEFV